MPDVDGRVCAVRKWCDDNIKMMRGGSWGRAVMATEIDQWVGYVSRLEARGGGNGRVNHDINYWWEYETLPALSHSVGALIDSAGGCPRRPHGAAGTGPRYAHLAESDGTTRPRVEAYYADLRTMLPGYTRDIELCYSALRGLDVLAIRWNPQAVGITAVMDDRERDCSASGSVTALGPIEPWNEGSSMEAQWKEQEKNSGGEVMIDLPSP